MKKKKTLIIVIIAAAVLVGVMLLLIFLPKGSGSDSSTVDEGVAMKTVTDKDGMHQAVVETEPNGEIKNNSYGTLIKNIPADIKTIHVENKKGTLDVISNTPKGEATVYKLKGYEDFALQSGIPDKIANAAATPAVISRVFISILLYFRIIHYIKSPSSVLMSRAQL